jgi:hypothetical protein
MPRMSTLHAVTTIGIDMGKNTLNMIGLHSRVAIVLREKVSRGRIALRLANLPDAAASRSSIDYVVRPREICRISTDNDRCRLRSSSPPRSRMVTRPREYLIRAAA